MLRLLHAAKYVHSYVHNDVTGAGVDLVKAWSVISTIAAT